jgi:tight adherence protein B
VLVITKEERRLSHIPLLNWALNRFAALFHPLQQMIDASNTRFTVGSLLLLCGVSGLTAYVAVVFLSGLVGLAALVAAIVMFVPLFVVNQRATRRMLKFEEQFPEAIDLIARALRAGHAFTTGLAMVAEEAPQPVGGEFRLLYDQQNFGMPLGDALRAFADRVPLLDARFFVTAVMTQREAGGNLAEVLDNLGSVIRERFKVKRQIRVLSAHGRITGFVLASLPPVLAIAMLFVTPEHMKVLINDPLGPPMVLLAITLQIVGSLIIRRIVDIEY